MNLQNYLDVLYIYLILNYMVKIFYIILRDYEIIKLHYLYYNNAIEICLCTILLYLFSI